MMNTVMNTEGQELEILGLSQTELSILRIIFNAQVETIENAVFVSFKIGKIEGKAYLRKDEVIEKEVIEPPTDNLLKHNFSVGDKVYINGCLEHGDGTVIKTGEDYVTARVNDRSIRYSLDDIACGIITK